MAPPSENRLAVFEGKYNVESVTVTVTMALSLYNMLELLFLIFVTFRQYAGLYFWSMLVSTVSIIFYCNGLIIEYFQTGPHLLGLILDNIGWMGMITGQSLVLYSRLGLILSNRKILQGVKWMIIVDALIFYPTTMTLNFGHQYTSQPSFTTGYHHIEHIQMTFFCIQEFIISGIYVWQTIKLLKIILKQGTRKTMWQLFAINVVIIILDIVLLAIEYRNLHIYEQSVKAFVYSVKLKLEFAILGKLIDLVRDSQHSLAQSMDKIDDYVRRSDSAATMPVRRGSSLLPWLNHGHGHGNGHGHGHARDGAGAGVSEETPTVQPIITDQPEPNRVMMSGPLRAPSPETERTASIPASVGSRDRLQGREMDMLYADMMRTISQP